MWPDRLANTVSLPDMPSTMSVSSADMLKVGAPGHLDREQNAGRASGWCLAELTGDAATATARYRQSHALDPHPANPAAAALRRLGLAP